MASTETAETAETATGTPIGIVSDNCDKGASTGPCQVCQTPSSLQCSACFSVYYCSPEHQKQDWKGHKKGGGCSPLRLAQDDYYGRYWIASRNIKAGELILKERPVIFGPSGNNVNVCISCCTELLPPKTQSPPADAEENQGHLHTQEISRLEKAVIKACRKCGWPVCGEDCEKAPVHADNECKLFVTRSVKFPVSPPLSAFAIGIGISRISKGRMYTSGISIIRGLLLKRKNPTTWTKIMGLQEKTKREDFIKRSSLEKYIADQKPFGMAQTFRCGFKVEDLEPESDWIKLQHIMEINQYGLTRGVVGDTLNIKMKGLYLRSSLFNHSCMPNAYRNTSNFPAFELQIRAATDIKKGEMITINYYKETMLYGTEKRLDKTKFASGFACQCARCMDPTELGTYMSAIICDRCPKNKKGIMLPTTFQNPEEPYRCRSPGCKNTKTRSSVNDLISKYHREISENESDNLMRDTAKLEKFISRLSGKVLHPNHWLLLEAERGCICAYEQTHATNREHLARYLQYGKRRAELIVTTSPGISCALALTQLDVFNATKNDVVEQAPNLSQWEVRNRSMELYKWASNSFKHWLVDVQKKSPEGELPEQMKQLMMEANTKFSELFHAETDAVPIN